MKEDKSKAVDSGKAMENLEDVNPTVTEFIHGKGGVKAVRERPKQKYPRVSARQQSILRRFK
jgi:hypothetical protein